ncbi:hypothetical protein RI054_07g37110 [Pseudoscourfieldia marina]
MGRDANDGSSASTSSSSNSHQVATKILLVRMGHAMRKHWMQALAIGTTLLVITSLVATRAINRHRREERPQVPEIIQLIDRQNETNHTYVETVVIDEKPTWHQPKPVTRKILPPTVTAKTTSAEKNPRLANRWTANDKDNAHWLTPFGTRVVPMLVRHRPTNKEVPAHVVGHVELHVDHRQHPEGIRSHLYAKDAVKPPHVKRTYIRNLVKAGNHEELASYLKTQLMQEAAGANTPHQGTKDNRSPYKYLSQRSMHGEVEKAVAAFVSAPPGKARNAALANALQTDEKLSTAMRDPGFRRVVGMLHGGSSIAAQKKTELSGHIAGAGVNPLALTGIEDPGARLAKVNMRATHTVSASARAHATKVMNQRGWDASSYAKSGHAIHAATNPSASALLAKPHGGTAGPAHAYTDHPKYHSQAFDVANLGKQFRQHDTRVASGLFNEHAQSQKTWTETAQKAALRG